MRYLVGSTFVIASLFLVGCESTKTKTVDACGHCPGIQTADAQGKCPMCKGMMVDGKCTVCDAPEHKM